MVLHIVPAGQFMLSRHCRRQHLASLAMAHVIGAGPVVKTCVDCSFYQYQADASAHSQYYFPFGSARMTACEFMRGVLAYIKQCFRVCQGLHGCASQATHQSDCMAA